MVLIKTNWQKHVSFHEKNFIYSETIGSSYRENVVSVSSTTFLLCQIERFGKSFS